MDCWSLFLIILLIGIAGGLIVRACDQNRRTEKSIDVLVEGMKARRVGTEEDADFILHKALPLLKELLDYSKKKSEILSDVQGIVREAGCF